MTKQLKSGEASKPEEKWHGSTVETQSDPLIDTKQKGAVVLRFFHFQANPELMRLHKPTKQDIFNNHAQQIRMMLWGDGLEPFDKIEPKIIISEKKDEYKIFVTCLPKKGVAINDTPLSLKQAIHG